MFDYKRPYLLIYWFWFVNAVQNISTTRQEYTYKGNVFWFWFKLRVCLHICSYEWNILVDNPIRKWMFLFRSLLLSQTFLCIRINIDIDPIWRPVPHALWFTDTKTAWSMTLALGTNTYTLHRDWCFSLWCTEIFTISWLFLCWRRNILGFN